VDVDRPAVRGEIALPHPLYQVCAAEHRRRVRAEKREQLELLEGQRDLVAVHPDPPLVVVQQQPGTGLAGVRGAGYGGGARRPARRGHRVSDDGQRRPGAGDRDHGEQRPVPARGRRRGRRLGCGRPALRAVPQLRADLHLLCHLRSAASPRHSRLAHLI
jgi:hypothetical protein